MLVFILTNNVFVFKCSHYLRVQGVAMGTGCAPSYGNLYLGAWERDLFSEDATSVDMSNVMTWHRYIDNVLMV